jgi:hypothetical protein
MLLLTSYYEGLHEELISSSVALQKRVNDPASGNKNNANLDSYVPRNDIIGDQLFLFV